MSTEEDILRAQIGGHGSQIVTLADGETISLSGTYWFSFVAEEADATVKIEGADGHADYASNDDYVTGTGKTLEKNETVFIKSQKIEITGGSGKVRCYFGIPQ